MPTFLRNNVSICVLYYSILLGNWKALVTRAFSIQKLMEINKKNPVPEICHVIMSQNLNIRGKESFYEV